MIFHIKTIKVFFIKNLIFNLHQQLYFVWLKKNDRIFFLILKTRQWRFNFTKKKCLSKFSQSDSSVLFFKTKFQKCFQKNDEITVISSFFPLIDVVNTAHKILNTSTKMKNFETIKKLILSFKKLFVINKKMNESF